MKFHFPVIITDEDFRSQHAFGSGIRGLAEAIEKAGMEVQGMPIGGHNGACKILADLKNQQRK
jgi:hypothetical protein